MYTNTSENLHAIRVFTTLYECALLAIWTF